VFAATVLGGCGYAHRELFPQQVRTVAVPIFENRTFYRDVEFDLTEALIKELELRTPYKVVRSGMADTRLSGTVVAVDQSLLSRVQDGGLPQEVEVTVRVDFEWKDLRTQEALRDAKGLAAIGRHIPTTPLAEPYEIARRAAVQSMAGEIVSQLRADW
jgi:hypothetical protein